MFIRPGFGSEQIHDGTQAATRIWSWVAWAHIW
jgi:hypothetical protein